MLHTLLAVIALALEFDVASVRPVKEQDCGGQRFRNVRGSLQVLNMEPTTLIENAFRLIMQGQLVGAPKWADHDCFDIEARVEEDPALDLAEARQRNLIRLQSLLATRFNLKFHWETRTQQGYVLSVAKNGPKLNATPPDEPHTSQQGRGRLICTSCTIIALTQYLSNFTKKPVQDQTAIQGLYDFNITFEPLDADPSSNAPLPSMFAVLKDLGLKLESRNIPVQTLVVDHIDHPTSN